ncbi:hypothetical protein GCM10011579_024470 [Streptomyces albiflavescens]|uniref:Uncharacterized protein n=1 Tax=Streptomyces albiflavescens TaxID=1623582 RepID=A0A917XZ23_9ACTN|nr:hypothetical protein GCM10011579_024470 [Streptomyces albiflavescens]
MKAIARQLPSALALTRPQYSGWACVWCGKRLSSGAVSAGIARGSCGAHVLDIEVYACPDCHSAPHTQTPGSGACWDVPEPGSTPARPVFREQWGRAGSDASHPRRSSTTGGIT